MGIFEGQTAPGGGQKPRTRLTWQQACSAAEPRGI